MKRMIPVLALVAGLVLVLVAAWLAQPVLAQDGEEDEAGGSLAAWRGAALYAEFCQACHGPRGEALGEHPAFAAVEYDPETAQDVIAHGLDTDPNDGVAMPPYAGESGGLLDGAQIDDLIAFMETWETDDAPPLPEPNLTTEIERVSGYEGDPQAGATVYAKFCYGCHGEQGEGRGQPIFSPIRRTSEIRQIVGLGYNSEYMPAFGAEAGGPLSDEDMDNLIAYVASWPLERAAAGESDTPIGLNLLIVFMGAAAIIGVAGVYLTNVVRTES
ncbi:MAG: c-type cytochrome [Chloroflexi bacterium]|jgi:mono/diheme cytochrome c family protein|nr:c-type cytochrome [Chloroflexota bacterium]